MFLSSSALEGQGAARLNVHPSPLPTVQDEPGTLGVKRDKDLPRAGRRTQGPRRRLSPPVAQTIPYSQEVRLF